MKVDLSAADLALFSFAVLFVLSLLAAIVHQLDQIITLLSK